MEYLLCTTPRVGSNLLCSLLKLTERAGDPGEYFCTGEMALRKPHLGDVRFHQGVPVDFQAYYDRCREVFTSESGHFGAKAHATQLRWGLEAGFQFERNMPTRFIHVSRADVTGQALSFARATQTGAWLSATPERTNPRFDADLIRSSFKEIVGDNEGWERLFEGYGIEPYRLSYEQLVADIPGELRGVLDYLEVDQAGLDLDHIARCATGYFKKQRDTTSEEWRRLWNDEVRKNAVARELPLSLLRSA